MAHDASPGRVPCYLRIVDADAGDHPAVQYVPPEGVFHIDILARLGEAFDYDGIEVEERVVEDMTMPIRKLQKLPGVDESVWLSPDDPRLWRTIKAVWALSARLCPPRFPRGLRVRLRRGTPPKLSVMPDGLDPI
jgi:hypothetical protein